MSIVARRILSGIQPTGVPHLGNYLGALRQWVKLQNEGKHDSLTFLIVDLHAITTRQDPDLLRSQKKSMLASLLAVGLIPSRSRVYYQSDLPQHSELMWILSCSASVGYLSRMTQWKSKLGADKDIKSDTVASQENLRLGLFSYPVLQAADILLHDTTHVPVGQDQSQHLEFARICATQFNHSFVGEEKPVFTIPEAMISSANKVQSLTDPLKKMSKSDPNPSSRILINDPPEIIAKKIRVALTDSIPGISYDPEKRPGVSNMVAILSHLDTECRSVEEIAEDCRNLSLRAFKERVASVVNYTLAPFRDRYESLMAPSQARILDDAAALGLEGAKGTALNKMIEVRKAMGLLQ